MNNAHDYIPKLEDPEKRKVPTWKFRAKRDTPFPLSLEYLLGPELRNIVRGSGREYDWLNYALPGGDL